MRNYTTYVGMEHEGTGRLSYGHALGLWRTVSREPQDVPRPVPWRTEKLKVAHGETARSDSVRRMAPTCGGAGFGP